MESIPLEDLDTWGQYLGYLRVGDGRHRAARKVEMSARSVSAWLGREGNEARRIEAADAEEEALELVEEALWQAAVAGEPWAVQRWLKFRAPDRWSDKSIGVGGGGSSGVVDPAEISRMAMALAAAAGVAVGRVAAAAEKLAEEKPQHVESTQEGQEGFLLEEIEVLALPESTTYGA